MDPAPHRVSVSRSAVTEDGLGKRYEAVGPAGELLEMLVLQGELSSITPFETALQESARQLSGFSHPHYPRIHGVHRLAQASALCVVSERVPGTRLSDVLAAIEQHHLTLDARAALALIQQLVRAVAALHEQTPGVCHGAVAPERIVVTPGARLVIVDHVFGAALEQLHFSHERYWKDLGIPLPKTGGLPRVDQRADVMQVAAVALAILHGRPLDGADYPDRLGALAEGASTLATDSLVEVPPAALRTWLARALQLDARQSFGSAVEASAEFDQVLAGHDYAGDLSAFLVECARWAAGESARKTAPAPPSAMPSSPRPATPDPAPPPAAVEEERPAEMIMRMPPPRRRWIAAVIALVALTGGGALVADRWVRTPAAVEEAPGILIVNTNPAGGAVVLDGERRGTAPLTLEVLAGQHVLEVLGEGEPRRIPLTIAAGATMSQHIELPVARARAGQLHVQSEPSGARVTVDGVSVGVAPLTVEGLAPGLHAVALADDAGSVTHNVLVEAGATASLVVPMGVPQGVPVSGWISVAAPVEVHVYEDERLLGSSKSDRIMVAVGRHELDVVSEALGYRARQAVTVSPGRVTPVRLDWPTGSVSANAQPWAEVWIDGEHVGETPIGNVAMPIGPHTVVFRHPQFGERAVQATVALTAPTLVSVDLRKP